MAIKSTPKEAIQDDLAEQENATICSQELVRLSTEACNQQECHATECRSDIELARSLATARALISPSLHTRLVRDDLECRSSLDSYM